jgi:hypothetical protein
VADHPVVDSKVSGDKLLESLVQSRQEFLRGKRQFTYELDIGPGREMETFDRCQTRLQLFERSRQQVSCSMQTSVPQPCSAVNCNHHLVSLSQAGVVSVLQIMSDEISRLLSSSDRQIVVRYYEFAAVVWLTSPLRIINCLL